MPAIETIDHDLLLDRLVAHVREAGGVALSMFRKPMNTWTKDATSPVSDADIAVNRLLRERLMAERDDVAWLSEESADDPARLEARRVWIVDPIDGTRGYIAGAPDWTISVALVEDGRPIIASLFAPVTDEMFAAAANAGATRNGAPIAATTGATLADARIAGPKGFIDRLATIAPPMTPAPRVASLALRLARVAQGALDIAIAGGNSHDWDLAAADLLVHEAGGAITPFAGGPVIYNRPVPRHGALVVAGRDRHATLIDLLRDRRIASL